ncbi:hypothetical protein TCAL_01331 [Tigriopus californicus]|uniref:Uncharacterized protein n=1 Tax=Tigriopus californicus TaxID=6832 RepID=A0A553PC83_TIGCA|nr:hypothetical protein TCAL_01331 [Tigriopus californicus]
MLIPWIILTASLGVVQESHGFINPPKQAEFVAGSFIITQKSLNEAPYRYAGILRKALDKVEQKDPPSKSDEESCSVRYRINPSGRPSKLRIIDESLSIVLRDNNTVIVAAKIFAEVAAKTWIWKGIYLLFGCVKLSSCNGQIVTYKADIDFQIGFQAFWIEEKKKLSFFIKPVNTAINNVEVSGCHPPWYLSWFKTWQDLLNAGVQEGFEDFARTYEHQAEIPEGFSPLDNVFIHYKVTNLIWNKHYVIFQANATFSALIDGKNQTFIPTNENRASVPIDNWKTISPKDGQSHLLQGVRVSTEFLNSLMWYATVTNVTRYSGNAQVLDSFINGTISYSPPEIRVEKDELLGIKIPHGLVLATCRPVTTSDTKTLFKAEFYDLAGSGRVKLKTSLSNKTGLTVSLNELDLSNMNTKPFEPKLPLPEAFEEELMRSAMAKLQPVVNIYLKSKPLYLPDNISPFADAPEMHLVTTGNGTGFAEILSYCTCSKTLASAYSNCDSRSHICDGKIIDIDLTPFDKPEDGDDSKVINSIKDGIKGIFGAAKDVISRRLNQSEPRHIPKHHVQIMFTQSVYRELALKTATPLSTNNAAIYVGIGSSVLIVFLGSLIIMFICKWNSKKTSRPSSSISFSKEKTKCSIVLKDLWTKHIGVRFLAWNNDGVSISVDIFNTDKVAVFADWLNLLTYFVNIINAVLAFLIVITWSFTKTGSRTLWMKVRLLSSVLLLSSIFVVIASVIFSTYFDDLVTLEKNQGVFITDNQSMYNMASKVLKVSLNGLSLTVISFTIVFLFHGVGGGLYFGTILFRLLHLHSKRSNMEILTTLLVILTVIQPFICLHPVIIWSQDSNHNSIFLILIILIWFLPVIVHAISKAVITHGRPKFISRINSHNHDSSAENKTNLSQSMRLKDRSKFEHRQRKLGLIFDFAVQVMQISFFLASFSIITHFIIHTEFNQNRKNLQDFVLPAIISVFCWMTSISYLLLSLVLDESRKDSRLVFKDQNLESARNLLRNSLKRRLQTLDHPSGPSNRRLPPLKPMRNLRRTLPANVSLSESLNGRDIHPEDSALVNVASRVKATPADVRQKVRKFEEIGLKPMVKRAEVYAKDPVEEISDPEVEVSVEDPNSSSCWSRTKRLYHFLVETREYKDPLSYGWRIKFRRIFLSLGVLLFTALTIYTRTKSYMMLGSVGLFWASLVFDFASHFAETDRRKSLLFTGSRITNFFGSLMVFASVIVVGLPDYLEASHLDEICPHCGENFNQTVRQVAEFSIGLFFACLFTFQLIPILITIIPALVRAAVLILIHPSLQIEDDDITSLRMTILQQVIQFASFLTFPITFISMAILQQYQKDTFVTMLIICFWTFPPFVLFLGLHYTRKYRRHKILIYIYYTYNTCYFVILTALVFYSMTFETIIETLEGMMREPTFWISSTSQVFLCNVVISDMLYMTVF